MIPKSLFPFCCKFLFIQNVRLHPYLMQILSFWDSLSIKIIQNEILLVCHILYAWKDWCIFSFWSSITSVGGNYPILEHQICVCVYYKQINVVILNIITLWCTIEWPNVKLLWWLKMGKRINTYAYPRCLIFE